MPHDHDALTRRDLLRRASLTAGALAVGGAAAPAAARGALATGAGAAGAATSTAGAAGAWQLARVWFDDATAHLLSDFDDTHTVFDDGSIELLLHPGDEARLAATGLQHRITVSDLIARDAAAVAGAPDRPADLPLQPGEKTAYRVLADFKADIDKLVAAHPTRARLLALPIKSHEGRTVYGIEIASRVNDVDGRPVYYMDGVHHAREWPSAEMPIMFAHDLLESYATDEQVRRIVDGVRTIIVPVMNPDGYNFSRSALVDVSGVGHPAIGNAYWRKNRRNDGHALDAAIPGYGAYGVDPNRNYADGWGGDGSSATSSSDTYRGPTPLSEPETRNVDAIMSSRLPTAMITNHTSGRLVLWAWSWTKNDLDDQALVEGLGRGMASYNNYKAQKSIDLYIHTGVCVDHGYGTYSSISYTFEHTTSFHPAYASTIPQMYAENRPAFLFLAEEACLPPEQRRAGRTVPATLSAKVDPEALHHAVISGRLVDGSGAPVAGTVRLRKSFETPLWKAGNGANPTGKPSVAQGVDATINTAPDGTFTWHVPPSTRPEVRGAGGTEAYRLTGEVGSVVSAPIEVTVVRGERRSLGDVTVG